MRNKFLSHLVLPLFTALSLSVSAVHAAEPAVSQAQAVQPAIQTPVSEEAKRDRIDLNKADAATLQSRLAGIGKTRAEAIVAYREAHGPFATVDELLEINGIGKALLERNRDKLMVE